MRKLAIFLGSILAIAVIGSASAASPVTITLDPVNNSGINGSAVLTDMGAQTQVVVTIANEPAGASEPIHIHTGQCGATLGGVKFPLKNVEGGTSTTVVDTTLASIQTGGFAINAHESAANIKNYVACGNIPALAAAATLPATGGIPVEGVIVAGLSLLGAGYIVRRRTA